jgi:hypothetical protein
MQKKASLYCGTIIHESQVPGYQVSYRFHVTDPVNFHKSIKVTMEHGHANHLADDWSSTAYWYQAMPFEGVIIQPVEDRIPVKKIQEEPPEWHTIINDEMQAVKTQSKKRFEEYLKEQNHHLILNASRTDESSKNNIIAAKRIRDTFDGK